MAQLNIQMTPEFERTLRKLMRARGLTNKSEAIRIAVREALERSRPDAAARDFREWRGLATKVATNPSPRFESDDDLWR